MYLIDTDVLSALRRRERSQSISRWVSAQPDTDLHLSVVSVGEIERGIGQQERVNPEFARALASWLDGLIAFYAERILAIDLATTRRLGRLSAKLGHEGADLLIAATALERGLTVVTRNVRHFQPTGVDVIDPSNADG